MLESVIIRTRREGIVSASTRVSPRLSVAGFVVPIRNNNRHAEGRTDVEKGTIPLSSGTVQTV